MNQNEHLKKDIYSSLGLLLVILIIFGVLYYLEASKGLLSKLI